MKIFNSKTFSFTLRERTVSRILPQVIYLFERSEPNLVESIIAKPLLDITIELNIPNLDKIDTHII